MTQEIRPDGYLFDGAKTPSWHSFLSAGIFAMADRIEPLIKEKRLFDLGCGNGAMLQAFGQRGWDARGVDPSAQGVSAAKAAHPHLRIEFGSAYEDLGAVYGRFPVVLCTEVIEHLYYPRKLLECVDGLLEPGGFLILSTPYHGYLKNLAMAVSGALEGHYDVLRDHGHIKFFSRETLTTVFRETGFTPIEWRRVGRIAPLAKCMVALVRRTADARD